MANVTLVVPFDPCPAANPSNLWQPPLRMAYLSAVTKARGHRVTVIDGVGEGYGRNWRYGDGCLLHGLTIPEVLERVPRDTDVLGLSLMFSQTYPAVRELLRELHRRLPETAVVLGGEGVSGLSEFVLGDTLVDAVVVGEGESAWGAILEALGANRPINGIANVVTRGRTESEARGPRRSGVSAELDALPFPDWDSIPLAAYWSRRMSHGATPADRYLPIIASRGCPYQCMFCTASTTWRSQRYRSPENVVAEMREFRDRYGIEYFSFNDLSITTNVRWFEAFLDRLIEANLGVQWAVPAGIRGAERITPAMMQKARASGLIYLQVAPETGSERVMDWLDKRFSLNAVLETIRSAKSADLPVGAYILVGSPVETLDDFLDTLRFLYRMARQGVDEIAVSALTAHPGSPLFWQLRREGRLTFDDAYFRTLAQGDLAQQVSYSPHFSGREIRILRLHAFLWFFLCRFFLFPRSLWRLIGNAKNNHQDTKLDRVLRYELLSVIRGFLPVLSFTSLRLVFALLRRSLLQRRRPTPAEQEKPVRAGE